jgi:exopolysaccharide biosynthesis polyprenyl glycosylphosphotransferase
VLLGTAFWAAYGTRAILPLEREFAISFPIQVLVFVLAGTAIVLAGLSQEIYERLPLMQPLEVASRTLRQTGIAFAALVVAEYALRLDLSRPFFALFGAYSVGLLLLFRTNAWRIARSVRQAVRPPLEILVVGPAEEAARLRQALIREQGEANVHHLPVESAGELASRLRKQVLDEVVFAVSAEELPQLEDLFLLCDEEGIKTRIALDFFPHVRSSVYLDQFAGTRLLTFTATPQDELRLMAKRAFDVVFAAVTLALSLPLIVVIAAAIRLTSEGPAIYRQVRCGLNGRRFTCYKFRSMVANADQLKAQLEHLNTKTTAFKIPNDPRLTPVGKWLRKFSLDEWPQFWNVLKGDMSVVGPRPPVPEEVERYEVWQRRRLRMRPGLTCLWALHGRDRLDFDTWMKMDMEYIDTWSLTLDLSIVLRTIPSVLTGRGAN